MQVKLGEKKLNISNFSVGNIKLYEYQAESVQKILENKKGIFVISAGTGMGKTAVSVASTILGDWKKTLLIYPTNELIKNQKRSILKIASDMGQKNIEVNEMYQYQIQRILDEDDQVYSKAQVVINLLRGKLSKNPYFVLTNPDTLHLILQLKYGSRRFKTKNPAKVLNQLSDYRMLVIDEFHYYKDRMLNNLLIDLTFAISIGLFDKILLMTATPDKTIYEYLLRISQSSKEKGMNVPIFFINQERDIDKTKSNKVITYSTDLTLLIGDWDNVEEIKNKIFSLKNEIKNREIEETLPLCVILDSVILARKLSEEIKDVFIISEIHGLVPQPLRKYDEQTEIIVGTNAIEVGIDFDTKMLIFEAKESSNFLQRLGRASRKRASKVWGFIPKYVYNYLSERIDQNKVYDKDEFSDIIRDAFIEKEQKYISSNFAKLEVIRTLNNLLEIRKKKVISSTQLLEKIIKDIRIVFQIKETEFENVKKKYSKLKKSHIESFIPFRSGEPQILVYDKKAEQSGFFAYYFSPVSRIIERAKSVLNVYKDEEAIKIIEKKKKELTEINEKESLEIILVELKRKRKLNEQIFFCTIPGYLSTRRKCKFVYPDDIPLLDVVVDENSGFFGEPKLQLTVSDHNIMELNELFRNSLFAIVPYKYAHKIDWRIPSFNVKSSNNQNSGAIFFNADTLVALAYFEELSEG